MIFKYVGTPCYYGPTKFLKGIYENRPHTNDQNQGHYLNKSGIVIRYTLSSKVHEYLPWLISIATKCTDKIYLLYFFHQHILPTSLHPLTQIYNATIQNNS